MADYERKRGDTGPPLRGQLLDADGNAFSLAGLVTQDVLCIIKRPNGTVRIDYVASIDDAAAGKVAHNLVVADVATAGDGEVEWRVTRADGTVQTFPVSGKKTFKIVASNA